MIFAFKPNCDNPDLSVSFSGLFDAADSDFLNITKMRLGLRYTVYEVSDEKTVSEWLKRKGI